MAILDNGSADVSLPSGTTKRRVAYFYDCALLSAFLYACVWLRYARRDLLLTSPLVFIVSACGTYSGDWQLPLRAEPPHEGMRACRSIRAHQPQAVYMYLSHAHSRLW